MKHYRTLTWTDRLKIEAWLRVGTKPCAIAEQLGVHSSTIYRELKRGQYRHLKTDLTTEIRYSPEISEKKKQENLRAKGPNLKIGNDHEYAAFLEYKIAVEKYSPEAVLGEIKAKGISFQTTVSKQTLYRYIDRGVFLTLTNADLPVKRSKVKRKNKKVRAKRPPKGESIEARPVEINTRETFGNWEMDSVEGKKGTRKTLLVLTERFSRREIVRLMPDKTAASVVKSLNEIEREMGASRFAQIFRSITVDNGSEFSDYKGIERSFFSAEMRTKVYVCHPYSSYERGSNENCNRLVRRHFPKGFSFSKTKRSEIRKLENWINNYPRAIFGYCCANDIFDACVNALFSENVNSALINNEQL